MRRLNEVMGSWEGELRGALQCSIREHVTSLDESMHGIREKPCFSGTGTRRLCGAGLSCMGLLVFGSQWGVLLYNLTA